MPRVLFVAYHFPPIGGGGVQRNAKFVRYLPRYGYEPVVVTGPEGARGHWTPPDLTLMEELPSQVEVHRVSGPEPAVSTRARALLERRLLLPAPFTRWWQESLALLGQTVGEDCDIVYGSLVPYESAAGVARLAEALGKPWVADLQDPWALDEMWLYPTEAHRRLDLRRMRRILGTAAAIVMNTPEAAKRVADAFPELRSRLVVSIPNGFDPDDFATPPPPRAGARFRIVHAGYLHTEDGLRLRRVGSLRRLLGGRYLEADILTRSHVFLLEALRQLASLDPSLADTVEVVLAGVLTETDRRLAADSAVPVELPGYLDHASTIALLRGADLLFLPMQDLPPGTRAGLVPGKTYEYLAARRPILAAVPDGDARDLLAAAGNASLCRPADTLALSRAIASHVAAWRAGAPPPIPAENVLARYDRRRLTEELARVFDVVLGSAGGARHATNPARAGRAMLG